MQFPDRRIKLFRVFIFLFICTTLNASWLAPMKNRAVSGSGNKVIPCFYFWLICTTLDTSWRDPMKNCAISWSENKPCIMFCFTCTKLKYFVLLWKIVRFPDRKIKLFLALFIYFWIFLHQLKCFVIYSNENTCNFLIIPCII